MSLRSLLPAVVVVVASAMIGVASGQTPGSERMVERGGQSRIDQPRQVTARTEAEWTALWREHAPGRPAPAVDFSLEMVLGVFLGSRPTPGYGVEIVAARQQGGELVVQYRETPPPTGRILAQLITSPFVIVARPRHQGPVRFEKLR